MNSSEARKAAFSKSEKEEARVPYSQASSPQCFFLLQLGQSSLPFWRRTVWGRLTLHRILSTTSQGDIYEPCEDERSQRFHPAVLSAVLPRAEPGFISPEPSADQSLNDWPEAGTEPSERLTWRKVLSLTERLLPVTGLFRNEPQRLNIALVNAIR